MEFSKVFGFEETTYQATASKLASMCQLVVRNGREGCVFAVPGGRSLHSGFLYTPSVRELRAEVAGSVADFERRHPGALAALRKRAVTPAAALPERALERDDPYVLPRHRRVVGGCVSYSHTVGSTRDMHADFRGALFQAASQFNLLEFIGPTVVPEDGIAQYVYDRTQGPAAAVACYAGTAYRNYLMHPQLLRGAARVDEEVPANSPQRGQTAERQADMLADVTEFLTSPGVERPGGAQLAGLARNSFYRICSGYYRTTGSPLSGQLHARVRAIASDRGVAYDAVLGMMAERLRIGVVEDATVTVEGCDAAHTATQTYNSALSLSRGGAPSDTAASKELLAKCVLRGTYEATMLAAVLHTLRALDKLPAADLKSGTPTLPAPVPPIFLTKVGGGVFHNEAAWIREALEASLDAAAAYGVPLDVQLVHFRKIEDAYVA